MFKLFAACLVFFLFYCGTLLAESKASFYEQSIEDSQLQFTFRASAISNLVYQLECMSGQLRCSKSAFEELWSNEIGKNLINEKFLKQWEELMGRYAEQITFPPYENNKSGFTLGFQGIKLRSKILTAALVANTNDQFLHNVQMIMQPKDVAQLKSLLANVQKNFDNWWKVQISKKVPQLVDGYLDLIEKRKLLALSSKVMSFYEADLPSQSPVYFHFIIRPGDKRFKSTNGFQMENHSIVETILGERPKNRIGVIFHELFHYFYDSVPGEKFALVAQRFSDSGKSYAVQGFNLMNEVLATVFGNGIVDKRILSEAEFEKGLKRKKSFYNDESIDSVAKVLLPLAEDWLANEIKFSSSEFNRDYLRAVDNGLAERKFNIRDTMREMLFVHDNDAHMDIKQYFHDKLMPGSVFGSSPLDGEATLDSLRIDFNVTVVALLDKRNIAKIQSWKSVLGRAAVDKILEASGEHVAFIYGVKTNKLRTVFLFVASSPEQYKSLVDLFNQAAIAFEGIRHI